nr:DNA (cytosine-5-)-methyltransferase [uncultured Draconibacterium sp.]
MPKRKKHIELFAGCGGMSLGLDVAGFDLFFANELSSMASETFAFNILGEDLQCKADSKEIAEKVLWIKSKYERNNLKDRLRENPFDVKDAEFSDLDEHVDLKDKLLVGNIDDLLKYFTSMPSVVESLVDEDIDLLSGGPPCQSFSLAGKREKNNDKNLLPLSFAKFAGLIQPKVVLLENVKGITAPFTEEGKKYYAWLEVAKAFSLEGFVPVCMMLNSKYFGVPQNRPRFILLAFREDVFQKIKTIKGNHTIVNISTKFYDKVQNNRNNLGNITINDFKYYDIENEDKLFDGFLLPKIRTKRNSFISVSDAIGDIRRTDIEFSIDRLHSNYPAKLNSIFKNSKKKNGLVRNHEPRVHRFDVKARFRFFQVINEFQNGLKKAATDLFKGKDLEPELMKKLVKEFANYNLLFEENGIEIYKKPIDKNEVSKLIDSIPSKKHSQRALREFEPAPAQLTIPDDLCHYHMEHLRTLTVREMARFQSFPDWFEFRSKVTTGGEMRKFEVPQYTQVGNAVPPLLAKELGITVINLLDLVNND